uniref:Uncharacterized protein n=1 Tax=Anguilla anguilla TaxID=7936 RepID=A0A0E9VAM9_ANGAN
MIYKRRVDSPALFTKKKHMLINEHIQTPVFFRQNPE